MEAICADLEMQIAGLTRLAKEKKFSVKDGLITVILPGGLIYAAIVQQQYDQAVIRIKNAAARLDEMTRSLTEYRLTNVAQIGVLANR
jgi:hypothetical protein